MGLVAYLLMLFEEALIYPASRYPQGNWNPANLDFEDVRFPSDDGTMLHGWYLEHPHPQACLLFCHGNGGNLTGRAELVQFLRGRFGVSVFLFDYRGYGKSEGRPSEQGILADARAARKWLADTAGISPRDVVLMGRSLGGAVAVDLAAHQPCRGLILESTFTSMPDVAAYHYPWFPVRLLLRTQYNSLRKIRDYHGPLLQSHSVADEVIPYQCGRTLFEAAPGEKQFISINSTGHNDGQPVAYYEAVEQFLRKLEPLSRTTRES